MCILPTLNVTHYTTKSTEARAVTQVSAHRQTLQAVDFESTNVQAI